MRYTCYLLKQCLKIVFKFYICTIGGGVGLRPSPWPPQCHNTAGREAKGQVLSQLMDMVYNHNNQTINEARKPSTDIVAEQLEGGQLKVILTHHITKSAHENGPTHSHLHSIEPRTCTRDVGQIEPKIFDPLCGRMAPCDQEFRDWWLNGALNSPTNSPTKWGLCQVQCAGSTFGALKPG